MNMGYRIRERLDELGWKQHQLLEKVPGLEAGTLSALIARNSKRSEWSEQIAEGLGVRHAWLTRGELPKERPAPASISADQQVGAFSQSADARTERPKQVRWHPVIAWETPSDLPDNEFALVSRRAVKLAAGDGKMVFEDEELPPLPFRADWLRGRRVTKHSNLVIVYAEGDSMEPDIRDGDAVLLDMGQRDVVDGQVYAIDYGGHLRVKRLQKRWDGGLIILSDNGEKYPPESLSANDASHITVLGRVIWRGGSL